MAWVLISTWWLTCGMLSDWSSGRVVWGRVVPMGQLSGGLVGAPQLVSPSSHAHTS
jgi:hypothetical protein